MSERMTPEKVLEICSMGIDCSQIVFAHGTEDAGFDKELAYKIGACFGGGMVDGRTCGAVTGALMAIGFHYGHLENEPEKKAEIRARVKEFEQAFKDENGSLICQELLGKKLPEQRDEILAEGTMQSLCPRLIASACDILDDLL